MFSRLEVLKRQTWCDDHGRHEISRRRQACEMTPETSISGYGIALLYAPCSPTTNLCSCRTTRKNQEPSVLRTLWPRTELLLASIAIPQGAEYHDLQAQKGTSSMRHQDCCLDGQRERQQTRFSTLCGDRGTVYDASDVALRIPSCEQILGWRHHPCHREVATCLARLSCYRYYKCPVAVRRTSRLTAMPGDAYWVVSLGTHNSRPAAAVWS